MWFRLQSRLKQTNKKKPTKTKQHSKNCLFWKLKSHRSHACMPSSFRCVWLCATLWTVAHQGSLSKGFSRQEYWRRLPCPPPGDLPDSRVEPASFMSPALAGGFFTTRTTWKALSWITGVCFYCSCLLSLLSCLALPAKRPLFMGLLSNRRFYAGVKVKTTPQISLTNVK